MLRRCTRLKCKLPQSARVVVIGGGIIGNSTAYHLAHMGFKDTVLLEQSQITSGTTWHAAGLVVTFGSLSETSTEFRKYTKRLYGEILPAETGQDTGFKGMGFIELACDPDRLEEFRRVTDFNRRCGVDVHEISPSEVKRLFPLCKTDDVLAGFYVPTDGRVNPVDATMALSKGAKQQGVKYYEGVQVLGTTQQQGRVTGVTTTQGDIQAEYVVNCGGMWARQLGQLSGVNIPNQAAEHYYLVTDRIPDVDPSWPVVEDPSSYTYVRPEAGGLMVGLFEPQAAAWNTHRIPDHFSFGEIEADVDRMQPFLEKAMQRVPITLQAGIRKLFCGPESFTPDLNPIIGEAPQLRNYFVAAGMNSIGILTAGGVGRLLAHWIINGKPDMDVTAINVNRFQGYQNTAEYRRDRVVESLGRVYSCHYPTKSPAAGRDAKHPPCYNQLKEAGAYFIEVSGWEAPAYYVKGGIPASPNYCWNRHNWFPRWEAEHQACRNGVVLVDMSFMTKYLVQGRDAGRLLNRLSTANVNGDTNVITYTQWLNEDGCMKADLTVIKMADDKFMVVASDNEAGHVRHWMDYNIEKNQFVTITDVTGAYASLNVQGPRSRDLLQTITDTDLSNEQFPFRSARTIHIGYASLLCCRITYAGELGYELYIPAEQSAHVYDRLLQAGQQLGVEHAGLYAWSSLRMEKGYRDYAHDMDNLDTILEVGLGFTCDLDKEGGFIGKEAVLLQKNQKVLTRRLLQVLLEDPDPMLFHGEVVFRNGVCVGDVRAGSYGHSLGASVGLAMIADPDNVPINKSYLDQGKWEVSIAGKRYPIRVSLKPMYDPGNKKIKM